MSSSAINALTTVVPTFPVAPKTTTLIRRPSSTSQHLLAIPRPRRPQIRTRTYYPPDVSSIRDRHRWPCHQCVSGDPTDPFGKPRPYGSAGVDRSRVGCLTIGYRTAMTNDDSHSTRTPAPAPQPGKDSTVTDWHGQDIDRDMSAADEALDRADGDEERAAEIFDEIRPEHRGDKFDVPAAQREGTIKDPAPDTRE
jgi:hypothetical protein